MSIGDPSVVDFVSIDPLSNDGVLSISEHLDWSKPDLHLGALERKLNKYMAFIESGELADKCPQSRGRRVRIEVVVEFKLSRRAREYIRDAAAVLEAARVQLRARRLGERAVN